MKPTPLMKTTTPAQSLRLMPLALGLSMGTVPALAQGDLGTWITDAPLPTPRQEMPHVLLDGKIYLPGGFDRFGGATAVTEAYDPATDTWAEVEPLPIAMHHPSAAAAGGKMYVMGGYSFTSFTPTARVFEYDPATDTWTEKTRMPTARGAAVAIALNGKIHVVGGQAAGNALSVHEVYDPATDTWEVLARMPTAREHLAGAALDGKVYIVGGRFPDDFGLTNRNTLEAYDPTTDTWARLTPMPTARGGNTAAALHGKLYVFGGEFFTTSTRGVFEENEEYDPATNTWQTMAPMPVPRHGLGAVAVGDTIFIIGGGPVAGFGTTNINAGYIPPQPAPTAIETDAPPPDAIALFQNYPNPFSQNTTIRFSLSHPTEVRLTVYDLLGRAVETLVQGNLNAGLHETLWQSHAHPPGLYLYRLHAGTSVTTKTLVRL